MWRIHLRLLPRVLPVFAAFLLALAPSSLAWAQGKAQPKGAKVRVLIGYRSTPGAKDEVTIRGRGGKVHRRFRIVNVLAASVASTDIAKLRRDPRVARVELDGRFYALDAELDNTWGVKKIGAGQVHDGGNRGAGVRVAVIDTGIDYTHPELAANFAGGYDFVNDDTDPMDDNGHGTHVAGTIAALDNGLGVVGAAPSVSLYALKVLDATGSGSFSDIIAALDWCVANGVQVTNNSYGSSGDPGTLVRQAFDRAWAAGVFNAAASGNSGTRTGKGDNVNYPARYDSAVAVAATDSTDKRASFSSTGPAVELAAPGVSINSTLKGGGYGTLNGTSMATPHVAGAAALVIASGIADANANGLINDDVRTRLQQTAVDLGTAGRDSQYGYGRIDAARAASTTPLNTAPVVAITQPANGSTFSIGATIVFSGTATDAEDGDLSTGLVWTSSLQGTIGTGPLFSAALADGTHTISAIATDSKGASGSKAITITVGAPALSVTVSTDKPSYLNKQKVLITVAVKSGTSAVAGSSVSVLITTANGSRLTGIGTTDTSGIAKFSYTVNTARHGTGTYQVAATASKSGYEPGSGTTSFLVTR